MSLAERVNEKPETIHGYPCSVGTLIAHLETLHPRELAAFQEMMYGLAGRTEPARGYKGWTEKEIFKAVSDEGFIVAKNQINEHRGKRCRCYRAAR